VIKGEDRDMIRRTLAVAAGGLLCAAVATAATVPAAASVDGRGGRPTGRVVIEVVKVNGSGCRPGTATVAVSSDNTAFTVTYSGYLAQAGAGAKKKDQLKNCKLKLKVGVPKGFTYTISSIDYRGYARLERGATGGMGADYSFQGANRTTSVNHPFTAPVDDDWQVTDTETAGFEPCGKQRALNIDTELEVGAGTSDPTSTSVLSMDSTDGAVHTTYHLDWQTC
jgi:Domain of unknown function (DUF4360)